MISARSYIPCKPVALPCVPLLTCRSYVLLLDADAAWRQLLTGPGQWLAGTAWTNITGGVAGLVAQVLTQCASNISSRCTHHVPPPPPLQFNASFRGIVLYDPAIFPTSLIASTAAGAESLLPICYRPGDPSSLYNRLVAGGPRLPVLRNLVGAFNGNLTGSIKRDACASPANPCGPHLA